MIKNILKGQGSETMIVEHWLESNIDGSVTHWCKQGNSISVKICTVLENGRMLLHSMIPHNIGLYTNTTNKGIWIEREGQESVFN